MRANRRSHERYFESSLPARAAPAAGLVCRARVASVAVLPVTTDETTTKPIRRRHTGRDHANAVIEPRALRHCATGSTLRLSRREGTRRRSATSWAGDLVTGSVRRRTQGSHPRELMHVATGKSLARNPSMACRRPVRLSPRRREGSSRALAPPVRTTEVFRVHTDRPTAMALTTACCGAWAGNLQLAVAFDTAGELLNAAIQLDLDYAQAHAHLAWWYRIRAAAGRLRTEA